MSHPALGPATTLPRLPRWQVRNLSLNLATLHALARVGLANPPRWPPPPLD
jgi:hypothetical protein